jgi:hypothetical protein
MHFCVLPVRDATCLSRKSPIAGQRWQNVKTLIAIILPPTSFLADSKRVGRFFNAFSLPTWLGKMGRPMNIFFENFSLEEGLHSHETRMRGLPGCDGRHARPHAQGQQRGAH